METINFENGLATLKEGCQVNVSALRQQQVFAKLMLSKGMKFNDVASREDFLLSAEKKHIRAELFWISPNGVIIVDERLFVNVNKDAIIKKASNMYYVELIHPTFDPDEGEVVDF